jgi:hypothetical protein
MTRGGRGGVLRRTGWQAARSRPMAAPAVDTAAARRIPKPAYSAANGAAARALAAALSSAIRVLARAIGFTR